MSIKKKFFLSFSLIIIFLLQVSRLDNGSSFEQLPIIFFIIVLPIVSFMYFLQMPRFTIDKIMKISLLIVILFFMVVNFSHLSQNKILGIVETQIPLLISIFFYLIIFELLIIKYNKNEIFILMLKTKFFYALIISAFGIVLWFSDVSILGFSQNKGIMPYDRMVGPFGSVKTFGYVSAIGFILALYSNNFFNNKKIGFIMKNCAIIITSIAIFYCGHKGSILAVLTVLIILFLKKLIPFLNYLLNNKKSVLVIILIMGFVVTIPLLILYSIDSNYFTKWFIVIFGAGELNLNNERFLVWSMYFNHFLNTDLTNKIFGHGHYSLVEIYGKTSHNSLLTSLLDHGIIVFILLIFLFLVLTINFINGFKKNNIIDSVAFLLLIFFLVSGFTNDTFLNVSSETFILCLISSIWLNRDKINKSL